MGNETLKKKTKQTKKEDVKHHVRANVTKLTNLSESTYSEVLLKVNRKNNLYLRFLFNFVG